MGATQTTNMLTSKLTVIALAVAAGLTAAYPASSVDYMTAPENEFVEARASTTCTPDPTQVYCINNVCQNTCAACPTGQGTECGAEEELVQDVNYNPTVIGTPAPMPPPSPPTFEIKMPGQLTQAAAQKHEADKLLQATTQCTPDPTQVYCINNVCQNTCAACPTGQGTECGAEE